MEADGGFVEHVEHAAEIGAELGGEADALGFAADRVLPERSSWR